MSTHRKDEKSNTTKLSSNRLFLKDLDPSLDRSILSKEISNCFKKYGKVTEVFLPDRSSRSYAFVSFESAEDATRALLELGSTTQSKSKGGSPLRSTLFQQVLPAYIVRNKKAAAQKKRVEIEWKQKFDLTIQSNVICQVHRSHVDRLIQFLKQRPKKCSVESLSPIRLDDFQSLHIVGTVNPKLSKTASLIFIHVPPEHVTDFIDWMENAIWFVRPVIHRIFQVDEHLRGSMEVDLVHGIFQILEQHFELYAPDKNATSKIAVRLHVFPPKLKTPLLTALEKQWENFGRNDFYFFTPTSATHSLGVIQVDDTLGPDVEGGLYAIGLTTLRSLPKASPKFGATGANEENEDHGDNDHVGVCRAHWKLQEVFDRYDHATPSRSSALTALDCGASPGGWTQFLSQELDCGVIYSVDPGQLDPSILQLPSVQHWATTIQRALPRLKENKVNIQIWVSDMCLKDTDQQVGLLLEARKMGVVGTGTFFVITIKVITGHSSTTFDLVVREQMKRLEGISKNVQQLHLFTNRSSERTIVGYLI